MARISSTANEPSRVALPVGAPLPPPPDHRDAFAEVREMPMYVSPGRLARLFDMHRQRIYELIDNGELAALRVGKRAMRISRGSVIAWLERTAGRA